MRDVVIKAGVYGRRDEKGRVLPVAKGERVTLSDEEAARLVALDVAVYADAPTEAPSAPPAPPPGGGEPEGGHQGIPPAREPLQGPPQGARKAVPMNPTLKWRGWSVCRRSTWSRWPQTWAWTFPGPEPSMTWPC